jgi:hypothetical protein
MWSTAWQYIRGTWPAVERAADAWRRMARSRDRGSEAGNQIMFDSARPMMTDSTACGPWIDRTVSNPSTKTRLLLWVDAVGGFFVCQGSEIRLGQAVPDATVEVPLLADLSRHHATIRRDEEGYTIEPVRDTWLNHQKIDSVHWINDGSLIALGPALRMRFSRPHPLSATARLDFISNHRTQPSSSSVLLMADTCVLGPGTSSHVVCRDWPHDVVLHRQHGGLVCRSATPFEVDGRRYDGSAPLTLRSRVSGDQFSFSLEEIPSSVSGGSVS